MMRGRSGRYRRAVRLAVAAGLTLLGIGQARDALAYTAAGGATHDRGRNRRRLQPAPMTRWRCVAIFSL